MRVLFMGTPELAAVCMKAVFAKDGVEPVGAVSQPDKPKGRGMKMIPTPVKLAAQEMNVEVYQPETLKDNAFLDTLKTLDPELIVVAAYGKILPPYILDYPKYGCINAHGSLLPEYRGASPIQRAIMDGKKVTGITAMYMEKGLDTGAMILKKETEISDDDDYTSLHDRLAVMAGETICEVIDKINDGSITSVPQDDSRSTYAAKILKEDTITDFSKSAREVFNLIRGVTPLAVTRTPDGKLLKLTGAIIIDEDGENSVPAGTVTSLDKGLITVACGKGKVGIKDVVPEGKNRMSADAYIRGRKLSVGDILKY